MLVADFRRNQVVPVILFALVALAGQCRDFYVPDPESGIHSISVALSRSSPGDVIRIAEGTYTESLVITTPSLTLIGEGNTILTGTVRLEPPFSYTIVGYPPLRVESTHGLRLVNLDIRGTEKKTVIIELGPVGRVEVGAPLPPPPTYSSRPTEAIVATSSTLTLVGCRISAPPGDRLPALRGEGSTIWIANSSVEGSPGEDYAWGAFGRCNGTPGGPALHLTQSCCSITSSAVRGGDGGDGLYYESATYFACYESGAPGGHGVVVSDSSRLQLVEGIVAGGDGGDCVSPNLPPPQPGGSGGDGVHATGGSRVQLADVGLVGGLAGFPSDTPPATSGEPLFLDSGSTSSEIPRLGDQAGMILERPPSPGIDPAALDLNGDGTIDVGDIVIRFGFCGN